MIKVDKNFYESGCIMEGKGNRVILKKDGETFMEMEFLGSKVKLTGIKAGKVNHCKTVNFGQIHSITIDNSYPPLPGIVLY